ncbi:MAG: beta-L-arabinofuranosidase domain-containing protein, partial [Planctomycetota bacterium]
MRCILLSRTSSLSLLIGIVAALWALCGAAGAEQAPDRKHLAGPHGELKPVPFQRISIRDEFWDAHIRRLQEVTLPDQFKMCRKRIKNFAIVAGQAEGDIWLANCPDSDLYKVLQGAAYTLAWRDDPELEQKLDDIIATIAAAQADDGYLNTQFMLPYDHPASPSRDNGHVKKFGYGPEWQWRGTIEQWPKGIGQLYCAGHLFEAAAVHYLATGKRNFVKVAKKLADHIYRQFPPGEPIDYADHPQAGVGLVRLYQVTGEERYLELARHILRHGNPARPVDRGGGESKKPVCRQREAWGHCVRTTYLFSAATDLVLHRGSGKCRIAVHSLWDSVVGRKMYITAGIGNGTPAEQHGQPYELPNREAYCETCASIGMGMWNHRMNLLTGEASYADLAELATYNGALGGYGLGGKKYFYENPLRVDEDDPETRRRFMFCCPSNVPRLVGGIGRWMYARDADGIYVNQYISGSAAIDAEAGTVTLTQDTQYPWDGTIELVVEPEEPTRFALNLRIPGWARGEPVPTDLYRYADPDPVDWTVRVN